MFFSTTDGLPQDFIYCLFHNSQPGQQHFQVRGVCLGNVDPLSPSSISRIFRKIRNQQIETYFSVVREEEQQEKCGDKDEITLALDSTSAD